jgi:peptidoglycan/xylan/chitin deacetylase (PgdA/CDA1 family)
MKRGAHVAAGIGLIAAATLAMARSPSVDGRKHLSRPLAGSIHTARLALTFDDLPAHGPLPIGLTRLAVARSVIAALRTARAPATGFVNGSFGANDPDAPLVLAAWRAAGLPLGNHTYSHLDIDTVPIASFAADIDRNEPFLTGQPKRFRYPFLAEGRDPGQRDAVRSALAARGYRIAAATSSFEDYAYNAPYVRCAAIGDRRAVKALEDQYLAAARADALRMRAISLGVLRRDVPEVLLLHIGAFTARMLPRLLAQYRQLGFHFVTLDAAQSDPFYAATDPARPGPSPTIERLAVGATAILPQRIAPPDDTVCAKNKL